MKGKVRCGVPSSSDSACVTLVKAAGTAALTGGAMVE